MQPAATEAALADALAKLENALLSPVVSGELASWAQTCREAMDAVARQLPAYFQDVLHPQYSQIARTDAELLSRIEQLIADDQKLIEDLGAFSRRVSAFVETTSLIKKHESKVADERASLEQDGIALIVRIKKQRVAADTWLSEAFYRDRGPVD